MYRSSPWSDFSAADSGKIVAMFVAAIADAWRRAYQD